MSNKLIKLSKPYQVIDFWYFEMTKDYHQYLLHIVFLNLEDIKL